MTKILVMSDSHGHVTAIKNAVRREKPDVVIFLGDCVPDMLEAAEDFPGLDVRCVRGNCDASPVAPERMRTKVLFGESSPENIWHCADRKKSCIPSWRTACSGSSWRRA